jgi:hypothetical protein
VAAFVIWGGDIVRVMRLMSARHSKELDPRMSLRPVFREVLLRPDGSKVVGAGRVCDRVSTDRVAGSVGARHVGHDELRRPGILTSRIF